MPIDRSQGTLRHRKTVAFLDGIASTRDVDAGDMPTATELSWRGVGLTHATRVQEDFLQSSSGTLVAPWATQDTSAAGSPTLDFVDDADNGEYTLASDTQAEAQKLTLYWGDSLHIDATKQAVFEARLKLDIDSAMTADDLFVCGLASARAADLDDIVTHAWVRVEGTDASILWESDDGSTDDDDNDSGKDLTDDTYFKVLIDFTSLAAVKFYLDMEDGAGWELVGTADMSDATGNLQPFVELQVGAAEEHALVIDYVDVAWMR